MNITASWTVKPQSFNTSVDKSLAEMTKKLATQVFEGVVQRTPVWTGRARACWTLNARTPVFKSIPLAGHSPASPLSAPHVPSLAGYSGRDSIYVANGQPYSGVLEFGGLHNAPVGMVSTTLASLKS